MSTAVANIESFERVDRHFTSEADLWTQLYKRRDLYAVGFQIRLRQAIRFVKALRLPVGTRALDIGCGGGWASIELARLGFDVTGVDISAEMIETARRNAGQSGLSAQSGLSDERIPRFEAGNLVTMSDDIGRFGLIVGLGVFEYFPRSEEAADLIADMLEGDGALVISSPNPERLERRMLRWKGRVMNRLWRVQRLVAAMAPRVCHREGAVASGVQRHNVAPDGFDGLWRDRGLRRVAYAANGLGCGVELMSKAPVVGAPLSRWVAGGLSRLSVNGPRSVVNACSGYLGVYTSVYTRR